MAGKRNIALEIGILEARAGLEPKILRCKRIVHCEAKKGKMQGAGVSEEDAASRLHRLRREIVCRKLFAVQKRVQKCAKQAKQAAVQRCIKRIRRCREELVCNGTAPNDAVVDGTVPKTDAPNESISSETVGAEKTAKNEALHNKIALAEEEMRLIKDVDVGKMGQFLLYGRMIPDCEYLAMRIEAADAMEDNCDFLMQMKTCYERVKSNALSSSLSAISNEIERFLRTTYHDHPEAESSEKVQEGERCSAGEEKKHAVRNNIHKEDDAKPAKNRMGQRARREQWEKMYGSEARHISDQDKTRSSAKPYQRSGFAGVRKPSPVVVDLPKRDRSAKSHTPDESKIHPSWEASRRAKENLKSALANAGTAKRTVFADD